jgi:hypothetical protein
MQHNDILTLTSTFRSARDFLEKHDLAGYVIIQAQAGFHCSNGDLKIHWSIGTSYNSGPTIECQFLQDGLDELIRRRDAARRMAPLSLPRVADKSEQSTITQDKPDSEIPF